MIKVAIVDDNSFLRKSILEKLSFFDDVHCKFIAVDGQDALEKLALNPTVQLLLMDIEMPVMNGIVACELLKKNYPHIKVIMLTVFDNDENIFNSIMAGADGYLLKELSPDLLYKAITDTLNGGAHLSPAIALKALKLFRSPMTTRPPSNEASKLTEREIQVLEQLSTGMPYEQIATNLFISTGTVRKHVENVYYKLQVHNKLEAIQKAKANKFI
jgi:DNA-binding NarL/FixJ family response regulator